MNLAPINQALKFEVTFDLPGLFVALSVYSLGVSPALILGPVAMDNIVANTYVGTFTATVVGSYLISKAVYTDGTFTTLHPDYNQGSETIYAQADSSGGGGTTINSQVIEIEIETSEISIDIEEC